MSHFWQSSHPSTRTRALLHEEVLGGAPGWPDRVALVDAATGRSATYGEIADGARRLAGGLRAGGARDGDVLALVASNGIGFPIVAHGALLAGLTLAPASPLLTARELGAFLRQTGARYVGRRRGRDAHGPRGGGRRGNRGAARAGSAARRRPDRCPSGGDPDATALLLSTSGTSGLPKSAIHTHAGAVAALRQYAASPPRRFGPDDVVAGIVPFAHMFGWVMLNSALRAGARMVTLARFELEAFLRMIAGPPRDAPPPSCRPSRTRWPGIPPSTATTSRRCASWSSAPLRVPPRSSANARRGSAASWARGWA